jgi:hypothetical protein
MLLYAFSEYVRWQQVTNRLDVLSMADGNEDLQQNAESLDFTFEMRNSTENSNTSVVMLF